MLDAVGFPYSIDGREVTVTISIGIAVFPQHGRSVEELIRNADTAMYAAKKQGKNTYRFHAEP
jgi:diguanylate cyclase (GGDEF)-like protein